MTDKESVKAILLSKESVSSLFDRSLQIALDSGREDTTLYLMNGICLEGKVIAFDSESVVFESVGKSRTAPGFPSKEVCKLSVVRISAVSTLIPWEDDKKAT